MGVKQAIKILKQRKEEQQQRQIAPIKTENPRGAIANEFKNFMMQTANNINNTARNSVETLRSRQNQTTEQENKKVIAPVGNIENKMNNKAVGLTGRSIAPTKNDVTLSEDDIKELSKKYNKTDIVTNQKTAESLQKAIEEKEQKEKIQKTEDTPIYDTGTKVKRNGKGEWEIKDKVFKEPEVITDLKDRIKKSGLDGLTLDEFKDNVVDALDTTRFVIEDSAAHGLGKVFTGIAGVGEGIDDAAHYGFAQLVKLAGNIGNNQELKDWSKKIEYDASKTGKWLQWLEDKTNDAKADSVFGAKSERVAEGVGSTIPTMLVDLLTTGGTGTMAKIGKAAGLGLMGMSSAGSSLSESYQTRGKLDGLAWIKAGIDGGTSIFVEQSGGMLGNGLSYDTKIANELTKNLKPSFKSSVISIGTRLGLSSIAEGNEEVIEAVANATTSKFANGFLDLIGDKGERYDSNLSIQEIIDNFTYGTIASLITQGGAKITQIGGNAVVNNETFNESVKQLAKAENISGQLEEKEVILEKYEKELNKAKTVEEKSKIEEKIETTKQEIKSLQANETEKDIKELLNERIDNNKIEQARENRLLAPVFNTEQQNNTLNIPQVEQTTRATAEVYKNYFKSDAERERIVTQLESIQNNRNKYNKNGTLNIVFDSTVNGNGVIITDKQGNRTIKINPKTDKAAEFVLIHELTHDIKGSKAFTELSNLVQNFNNKQFDFVNTLESIKNTYEEFYNRNKLDLSNLDIHEEAMADVLGTALGNQQFVNQLAQKPTLFQRIKNWVSKQITIHKSSDKEFTRWLYNVQDVFKNAVRENNNVNTNGIKYSIQTDNEGNKYVKVDTDQHIFENANENEYTKIAKEYILNKFRDGNKKINLPTKEYIKVTSNTAREYTHPKNKLATETKKSKMKASTELDNIIQVSEYKYSRPDDGRHKIAKDGWDYYKTVFEVDGKKFEGLVNIAKSGNKKTLYDITKIKELVEPYSASDKSFSVSSTNSNNSIPPTEAEVNTANSNSTQESTKYSINSELEKSSSFSLQEMKEKQLEIINKTNPADDDIHTWIRSTEDIKTFNEAFFEDGEYSGMDPDFDEYMAKEALNSGKITVYSSYPIENGTFVSPSIMEAEQYAGGDSSKLYSKEVNIDDIAWIDGAEGQYARLENNLNTRDNKGRILSKEQQEYFKDSKVLDRNGKLLTLFHGTPNDFNTFDIAKLGSGQKNAGNYGDGFYFTPNKNQANDYAKEAKIKEVYLNIKNPFIYSTLGEINGENTFSEYVDIYNLVNLNGEWGNIPIKFDSKQTWNDVKNAVQDYIDSGEDIYRIDEKMYDEFEDLAEQGLNDRIYRYSKNNGYKTLREVLQQNGYDGIFSDNSQSDNTQYVAFESNQIKNIDNTNPTNNPDIRYSQEGKDKWKEYLDFIGKKVTEAKGKQEKTYFNKQLAPVKEIIQETNSAVRELKEEIGEIKKNIAPVSEDDNITIKDFGSHETFTVKDAKKKEIENKSIEKIAKESNKTAEDVFIETSKTKIVSERKQRIPFKEALSNVKKTAKDLQQLFVNKMQPIDDLAKRKKNKRLKHLVQQVYGASGIGQYNIGIAQTDINGNKIGDSIQTIFEDLYKNKKRKESFDRYAYLTEHIDRIERGRPIFENISKTDAMTITKDILSRNPEFKEILNKCIQFEDNVLKMQVDAGFISKADAKYIKEANPNYIPVERLIEPKVMAEIKTVTSGKGMKKAVGGNADIFSVDESMAMKEVKLRAKIAQNELIKELAKIKGKYQPIANTSTQYKTEMLTDTNISEEDLHFVLDAEMEPDAIFDKENESVRISENGEYKAVYFEDGIGHEFAITKEEYNALKGHESNAVERALMKTTGRIAKWHKSMLTTYNPVFLLVNSIKDIQDLTLNSKHLGKDIITIPKALTNMRKSSELWNLYLANGGGSLSYFDRGEGIRQKTKNPIKLLGRAVEFANEKVEQFPRFLEFVATIEKGGTVQEAIYDAAEVTTNFSRGGDITKAIDRCGGEFINAAMQGTSKFIRNFTEVENAKEFAKITVKAVALGMAPALANALIYGDDEEYESLPDSDKDLYYLIKLTDDGKFLRLPKGRALSVFGTFARSSLDFTKGDKEAYKRFPSTVMNQVGPNNPLTNHVLAPVVAVKTNTSWFGQPIVSSRLQKKNDEDQYDEKTSDIAIKIGKITGKSPKKIDYLLDQYTGGIGDVILPMTTKAASNKGNVFADKFTTDSVLKNKYVGKFYDTLEQVQKDADSSEATEEDILKAKYLDEINANVNKELYDKKREIQNSNLNNKEKSKQVREIQQQINERFIDALNTYEKIEKSDENIARIKDYTYVKLKGDWKEISDSDVEEIEKVEKSGASADDYLKYKIATYHTSDEEIDSKEKNLEKLNYIKNIPSDKIRTALYENTVGESDNNFRNYKGSSKAYIQYKIDTKEATEGNKNLKQDEKIDILLNNGYKDSDIKKIYENQIKNDEDLIYDSLKDTIDIKEYLKYKQQDFESDKLDDGTLNGKSVSGSAKQKVYNYINGMNISYEEKLILIGSKYKLTNAERKKLAQYINTLSLSKQKKLELYGKMKGFTAYKDGRVTW